MKKLTLISISVLGILVVFGVQTTIGQQNQGFYQNYESNQQRNAPVDNSRRMEGVFQEQETVEFSDMAKKDTLLAKEKKEDEFVEEKLLPQNLMTVPTRSKVHFIEDFIIPANESSILIGSNKEGEYLTECRLNLSSFKTSIRKIPAGTEFDILDTRQEFGLRVDLLLDSTNLRAVSCNTYKPIGDSQNVYSESDFQFTDLFQAIDAMDGKVELKINDEPMLITN
ncbi:MAG: hypothetical protein QNJ31_00950 [Candidatus Caenarcaniphilales bacterium]|nr:hypothetical protein [Candidatus Caenarcaniphilales bacterium]